MSPTSHTTPTQNKSEDQRERVCLIGSGNWGSAIAKIVGVNTLLHPALFQPQIRMWVFEEMVDSIDGSKRKLTDVINETHENVKYLPGIKLPETVKAFPSLLDAASEATLLVFVLPHQGICSQLAGRLPANAKAISLIKGVDVGMSGLVLISDLIRDALNIDVSVLMGANIASEVAQEQFCETTIGYRDEQNGELMAKLFHAPYFHVNIVHDVTSVELCGALKNVVGVAAGLVDGLKMGDNTKAAIIRIGLMEMRKFCKQFYTGVKDETFFESCGVADLITTCYGGRNRKVAEAHVLTGKSFEVLEKEMLNGQKLQGTLTAQEIYEILNKKQLVKEYPLFTAVYRIVFEHLPPTHITSDL